MTSRVDVANFALIKLGVPTIADLTEDSEQALKTNILFDRVLRSELRKHPWSFAMRRTTLAAMVEPPAYEWRYQYQLPGDFLRVVQVNDYYQFSSAREATDTAVIPYTIEGQKLLTDYAAPLRFRYVADVGGDPSSWDACFVDAFSCRMAEELCETLTKSGSKKVQIEKDYQQAVREAKRVNAIELPPAPLLDNSWFTARY